MDTLEKYVGRNLIKALESMQVVRGQSKEGNTYYCIELTFINGYKHRVFLRGAESFAWATAFDLIDINKTIQSEF